MPWFFPCGRERFTIEHAESQAFLSYSQARHLWFFIQSVRRKDEFHIRQLVSECAWVCMVFIKVAKGERSLSMNTHGHTHSTHPHYFLDWVDCRYDVCTELSRTKVGK